jgi:hypothetical protein
MGTRKYRDRKRNTRKPLLTDFVVLVKRYICGGKN